MSRASRFVPALALFAATACSSITTAPQKQPAPAMRRGGSTASTRAGSTASTLGVPPGQLPAPGMCRVWVPGRAPGQQAAPRGCARVEHFAPAGSWILYRPTKDRKVIHVRVVDDRRAGVVVARRVYDARKGNLVHES